MCPIAVPKDHRSSSSGIGVDHPKNSLLHMSIYRSFLNWGFDDALAELVINDGGILGGDG